MKKLLVALLLVSFVPSAFAAIWESDMSTLTDWGQGSNAADEYDPGGGGIYLIDLDDPVDGLMDAVQMNSWSDTGGGTAGYTDAWYNTTVVIQDETDYVLTVTMESYVAGGQAVPLSMQDVTGGWVTIVTDSPVVSDGAFADYSISFSTVGGGPNDNLVGSEIGIGISPGWWNNLAVDHITLVPEPATICLIGLGGVLLRRRKK